MASSQGGWHIVCMVRPRGTLRLVMVSDLESVVRNPALSFFLAKEQYTSYEWLIKGK
jgi:hypothetical protein